MAKADILIYELKITLKEISPPIWRRIQVRRQIRLGRLHLVIQAAMGWTNSHLHEFRIRGQRYQALEQFYDDLDDSVHDEREYRLVKLVGEGETFEYEYDFGDDWQQEIVVEKVLEPEAGAFYPRCVDGARACPPEDCGGPWGYEELLEVLADPGHEEHEHYRGWAGKGFDPEKFNKSVANRRLRRV